MKVGRRRKERRGRSFPFLIKKKVKRRKEVEEQPKVEEHQLAPEAKEERQKREASTFDLTFLVNSVSAGGHFCPLPQT